MTSKKWLRKLRKSLSGISADEKKRIIEFYREMIADRIEDGMTEGQAIESLGSPELVAQKIQGDDTTKKTKPTKKRRERQGALVWKIIGLTFFWSIFGIPLLAVWLAVVAVVFALVLCGGVFTLCGAIALPVSVLYLAWEIGAGLTLIGCSILLIGLGLIFIICIGYLAKYCLIFTKKIFKWAFKGVA